MPEFAWLIDLDCFPKTARVVVVCFVVAVVVVVDVVVVFVGRTDQDWSPCPESPPPQPSNKQQAILTISAPSVSHLLGSSRLLEPCNDE